MTEQEKQEEVQEEVVQEETQEDVLALDNVEATPEIDLTEWEGKKLKIERLSVKEVDSPYDANGKYNPKNPTKVQVLKVETEAFTEIEVEGKNKPIRASRLFNLKLSPDTGKWGVSTSERSKLRAFFNKMKVESVNDLKGKEVVALIGENNFMEFAI